MNYQLLTGRINFLLFIGTERGNRLLMDLIRRKIKIVFAFILKEDRHERAKYSRLIKNLCLRHKIKFKITKRIDSSEEKRIIFDLKPDIIYILGWRTLISEKVIDFPVLGTWAAHDSPLPKYRGFAPTNWAIINGEKRFGATLFKVAKELDSGDIFKKVYYRIKPSDTINDIYPAVAQKSVALFAELTEKILSKQKISLKKQNHKLATYTCKRLPKDGLIDWNKSAEQIHNFIRALVFPWPGAFSYLKGKKIILLDSSIDRSKKFVGCIPGRILEVGKEGVLIGCGRGYIRVKKVYFEAKTQDACEVLNRFSYTLYPK